MNRSVLDDLTCQKICKLTQKLSSRKKILLQRMQIAFRKNVTIRKYNNI